jgi:hypothetical protein
MTDDLNAMEGASYDQQLTILEMVVDRLNAACARRELRAREGQTLQ